MTGDNSQQTTTAALNRRSILSAMSGITLGTMLPMGASAAQTSGARTNEDYEAAKSASRLIPRPDGARRITPDRSSRGNDATVIGDPQVVTDPSERALDLAGESYVAIGDADSLDFTSPGFSVQLTFKYSADTLLFSKGGSQYSAGVYGGELSFWTEGGGNWPTANGGDLTAGEWYTATFVMDENELRLHVDGERVGATVHDFPSPPSRWSYTRPLRTDG